MICMSLFSCLIAMPRTFSTMSNKTDKSRYPCLVLDCTGNALIVSLASIMLAVNFYKWSFSSSNVFKILCGIIFMVSL